MTTKLLEKIPYFKLSHSQIYNQKTKIVKFVKKDKKTTQEFWPNEWVEIMYKGYPRFSKLKLPKPKRLAKNSIERCMINRKSVRDYSASPLTLNDLTTLLYYTAGLRKKSVQDVGNRFYPSAGARYPLEAYPIVFNIEGINQGIYHYHLKSHSLEFLWSYKNLKQKVLKNFNQSWIKDVAVLFVVSAIFWRTEVKYKDRGYRFVLLDAGHLCQNFYLVAEALGLGCCSIGGFVDDGLNKLLDLDGQEESVIIVLAIGNKKTKGGDKNGIT